MFLRRAHDDLAVNRWRGGPKCRDIIILFIVHVLILPVSSVQRLDCAKRAENNNIYESAIVLYYEFMTWERMYE